MVQETGKYTGKYTVITGASSGIGYETAKVFAERGKNLVITARRKNNLEMLKREILEKHPDLDIVIRSTDLSVLKNAHQLYEGLRSGTERDRRKDEGKGAGTCGDKDRVRNGSE